MSSAQPATVETKGQGLTGPERRLKIARRYAQQGWSVFPVHIASKGECSCSNPACTSKGKHPWTDHGFSDATTNMEQIRLWWEFEHPVSNIGIRTGQESGLVVLDIDPRHGGDETLRQLEAAYGALPETLTVLSGGGGRHLYFQHPGCRVRSVSNALGAGLDVRGDGGFIVAPPSLHVSGTGYTWESGKDPDKVQLAPLPDWLLKQLKQSQAQCEDSLPERKNLAAQIIPEGQRNTVLTSLAGAMWRQGVTEETLVVALLAENSRRCVPPLPEDGVKRIAHSIARYPVGPSERQESYTDLGNARRFVKQHGEELRYVSPWKRWLIWDGQRWGKDDIGEVIRRAKKTIGSLYVEANSIQDDDKRRSFAQHIARSESHSRLTDMVKLAESEPGIPVTPAQLDADPWVLNVLNGVLDLCTGKLREHRRDDLLTKLAPVAYDAAAVCPTWEAFLSRVLAGDVELIRFAQKALGYSLTGSTQEQCLFMLYGTGANGKSTFIQTISVLLGDYAQQTPTETLLVKTGGTVNNDVARLQGARWVAAVEAEHGKRLAEVQVKQVTGGDTITARFLYGEYFEYQPAFKLWLAVNHKPVVQGTDHAIWRRIRLLPFAVTIPDAEQDKRLTEKLRAELPGILRWAVEGCLAWLQEGLEPPSVVKRATGDYRAEMDVITAFLQDCCVVEPQREVSTSELYKEYVDWCTQMGESAISKKALSAVLKERGCTQGRRSSERLWCGIALRGGETAP